MAVAANKNCITHAIAFHREQAQFSQSNKQKVRAIMFLGHWLGDIHQPLHVSFASDLGGNKTSVSSEDGKCTNMHWLWDGCLLERQVPKGEQPYATLLSHLKVLQKKSSQTPAKGNEIDWANETFAITVSPKIQYCQQTANGCQPVTALPIRLTDSYQAHFGPILNQQILKAATRLANELNTIL